MTNEHANLGRIMADGVFEALCGADPEREMPPDTITLIFPEQGGYSNTIEINLLTPCLNAVPLCVERGAQHQAGAPHNA